MVRTSVIASYGQTRCTRSAGRTNHNSTFFLFVSVNRCQLLSNLVCSRIYATEKSWDDEEGLTNSIFGVMMTCAFSLCQIVSYRIWWSVCACALRPHELGNNFRSIDGVLSFYHLLTWISSIVAFDTSSCIVVRTYLWKGWKENYSIPFDFHLSDCALLLVETFSKHLAIQRLCMRMC